MSGGEYRQHAQGIETCLLMLATHTHASPQWLADLPLTRFFRTVYAVSNK